MIKEGLQYTAYFKFIRNFDDALHISLAQAREILMYQLERSIREKNNKLNYGQRVY